MAIPVTVKHRIRRRSLHSVATVGVIAALATATVGSPSLALPPSPPTYAPVLIDSAARAIAMNSTGVVVGTYLGVGPTSGHGFVWSSGKGALLLPTPPGSPYAVPIDINDNGWVAGTAYTNSSQVGGHAVAWKPVSGSYQVIDLGVLPGTTQSSAAGIDALNEVVGWSTTAFFPPTGAPFLWSETAGLTNLATSGYPNSAPGDISPNGTVLVANGSYRLGHPASFQALPPAPAGWYLVSPYGAINDSGDQVRVINPPSAVSPLGVFRLDAATRAWAQVGTMSQGSLSANGLGNLDNNGDFAATLYSTGVVGFGPSGAGQSVTSLISPAYPGASSVRANAVNNARRVAGQVIIGRSPRLVRLDPVVPCIGSCVRVASITVSALLVSPTPGQCLPSAHTHAVASVTVTTPSGAPVPNATVKAKLLDDVSVSMNVSATTNAAGVATITRNLPPCGGAVALLVTNVVATGTKLDRTVGELTDYDITH